jgi:hypothetical protein
VGFGGKCGGSRAARADGTGVWACYHRAEQLARQERDWAAHTTVLRTADAAKWVNRQEHCLTQPHAAISMSLSTGPCGREAAEAASGVWPHPEGTPPATLGTLQLLLTSGLHRMLRGGEK